MEDIEKSEKQWKTEENPGENDGKHREIYEKPRENVGNIGKRWKIDGEIEMSHDFTIKNVGFSMRFR